MHLREGARAPSRMKCGGRLPPPTVERQRYFFFFLAFFFIECLTPFLVEPRDRSHYLPFFFFVAFFFTESPPPAIAQ